METKQLKKLTQLIIVLLLATIPSVYAAQEEEVVNGNQSGIGPSGIKAISKEEEQVDLKRYKEEYNTDDVGEQTAEYFKSIGLNKMAEFAEYGTCGILSNFRYTIDYLAKLPPVEYEFVKMYQLEPFRGRILSGTEAIILFAKLSSTQEVFKLCHEERLRRNKDDAPKDRDLARKKEQNKDEIEKAKKLADISAKYWLNLLGNKEAWYNAMLFFVAIIAALAIGWSFVIMTGKLLDYCLMRKPELIMQTNIKFGLLKWFRRAPKLPNRDGEIILHPNIEGNKNDLIKRIKLAKNNSKVGIPNLIFEGVPGVGKTATAMEIIRSSGCYYAKIDGARLLQWTPDKAIEEANRLLKMLKGLGAPVYLYIEEGDVLFGSRLKDKEVAKVLTPFLSQLDKTDGNMALMISTNLYDKLDQAIINRVSDNYIWKFERPTIEMATDIACNYIDKKTRHFGLKSSILLDSKNTRGKIFDAMAEREGIVGRSIEALIKLAAINALQDNKEMTLEGVMRVVEAK